jgi:hypothetical protein
VNAPQRPLSPDVVDELLSADLDGEFGRAAADLGFTPDEARTALDAAPGLAERRAALSRARDVLAMQPVLEREWESRFVVAAADRFTDDFRDARDPRGWFANNWRALVAGGAAAAAVAGFVALGAANGGSESRASTASPVATAPHRDVTAGNPERRNISFGDVTDANSLRARVRAKLSGRASGVPLTITKGAANPADVLGGDVIAGLPGYAGLQGATGAAGVTGPQGRRGDVGLIGPQGVAGATNGEVANGSGAPPSGRALQACLAAGERDAQVHSSPVLSGMGTAVGRPVIIVVFERARSYLVYELNATDCSVITLQMLP